MDDKNKYYDEEMNPDFLDDTIIEEEDHTIDTMKVRKALRFRTLGAAVAVFLFFILRNFDPNIDFNNVNSPLFLAANVIVLFLVAIVYFYDNSIKTIQYKKEDIYKGYKIFNGIMEIAVIIPYLSMIVTILNVFFISLSPITGTSMMPSFTDDDAVIFSHLSKEFERYDVIILHQESEATPYLIKRVVGLPGETVSIDENRIFINDVLLIEEYIDSSVVKTYCTNQQVGEYIDNSHCSFTVGENEYFVLGDNRDGNAASSGGTSIDSRYFGPVHTNYIFGKVVYTFRDYNIIK